MPAPIPNLSPALPDLDRPADASPPDPPHTIDDAADAVVCEACGYRLTGLSDDDRCPECGTPVRLSTVDSPRVLTAWEERRTAGAWWQTSRDIWRRPGGFFRRLRTRVAAERLTTAGTFGVRHVFVAAFLASVAVAMHYALVLDGTFDGLLADLLLYALIPVATLVVALVMLGLRRLVVILSAFETRWRGMRLPRHVIERGLDYHTAQITPVCTIVLAVVVAARVGFAAGWLAYDAIVPYLFVLCGVVIAGAVWLFWTYWLAMKNLLHANV